MARGQQRSENALSAEVIETTPANVIDAQERAVIDLQIATAKSYPRDLTTFTEKAVKYATLTEETAEGCIYRRPVGKDKNGKQKYAEGLSVRTAEIVFSTYGNIRAGARIVSQTERQVIAQGVCHDIENNVYVTTEVVESTVDKYGNPYDERMRLVTAKAAMAKARRDAIFQVVPKALAQPIEKAVRDILFGNTKTLTARREAAMAWVKKLPINDAENRVFAALGVKGVEDIGAKELELLTGLRTSIKENDSTPDEAFPPIKKSGFDRAIEAAPTTEEKAQETPKKGVSVKLPAENPPSVPPRGKEVPFMEAVTQAAAMRVDEIIAKGEQQQEQPQEQQPPAQEESKPNDQLF